MCGLKRQRIAVRWSAPEVLLGRPQSPASNVWSYGVLAWEVMSLGQLPYEHWNDDEVAAAVTSGAVPSIPSVCILVLFFVRHLIMLLCILKLANIKYQPVNDGREITFIQ